MNVPLFPSECPPPELPFAQPVAGQNSSFYSGDRAEFMCKEGYRTQHTKAKVIHIECSEDGDWVNILGKDVPIPSCQRKYLNLQVSVTSTSIVQESPMTLHVILM